MRFRRTTKHENSIRVGGGFIPPQDSVGDKPPPYLNFVVSAFSVPLR